MPRVRSTKKLDTATLDELMTTLTATEQQAVASARWLIELRGGLSHKHSRDYWRFSTKAELSGQVEAGEKFVQGIKNAFAKDGEVSISFLPGPGKWNEKLATTLVADAKQGDMDADQALREVAAGCLERGELPPKPLVAYAATYLQAAASSREKARQQPNSSKQLHKTDYRDWILALTVDDVALHFKLNHTRNDATEKHCACSIIALATGLHENTVQNVWHDYEGVADQRDSDHYVAQATVSVPARGDLMHFPPIRWGGRWVRPTVVSSDGAQKTHEHFLVRFPRVGSAEAVSRPSNRKAERAKRNRLRRKNRPR
jgi:hypothetical protein